MTRRGTVSLDTPELVIVGDEAYTGKEWARRERQAARARERYATDPEYRRRQLDRQRRWAEANREHVRAYGREWMRRYRRRNGRQPIASLHALRCTGPTRATGCRCVKIRLFQRITA